MLDYDYTVVYRQGNQNTIVDALSWRDHSQEGQMLQCVANITWSEVWGQVLDSCLTDPVLQKNCADLVQNPQLHSKYTWD